uniref:Uncharacterized protein n=1 Tax=viral metagenome TaxID=1070528 RepID=A0A6C0I8D0_9ZZZZ
MELVVEPDIYSPSINDTGIYVDKVPPFNYIKKGLVCPCGSRKDKIYETHSVFVSHTKTKVHQKWLEGLNLNKANFYVELEKSKEVISNQRLIIAKLEKDINNKIMTIDYLTQQLHKTQLSTTTSSTSVINLLDFD